MQQAGVVAGGTDVALPVVTEAERMLEGAQILAAARESDRVWRAERIAELERRIHQTSMRMLGAAACSWALTILVLVFVVPSRIPRNPFWLQWAWRLAPFILPLVMALIVLVVFEQLIRPLEVEKAAYGETADPSSTAPK